MEAIILAGGLGTRLAGRLAGVPKPMAPINGRPFLEILLQQLASGGFTRVLLSVGYLHSVIEEHFGTSFGGIHIEYMIEDKPLGTGGAIRASLVRAAEDSVEDSILVLNGDTFLDADYAQMMRFHAEAGATMTMAVTHQANVARYGAVVIRDSRIVGFEEKGNPGPGRSSGWINAGAYVLDWNLQWPRALGEKFSFETEFLAPEIARLAPLAFEVNGFFLDIGVLEDLDRAQTALANR
jgi:D-glycero-alpha-D-manno-heptose 1-phosphate guanylyltransferase